MHPGMRSSQLDDTEICYDILECQKSLASAYTKAALESADPNVRRSFRQLGRDVERLAYRAFEILHEQGQYQIKQANPQQIRHVETMLSQFARDGLAALPDRRPSMRPRVDYDDDLERAPLPEWARARD